MNRTGWVAALAAVVAAAGLAACAPSDYYVAFFGDVPYSSSAVTKYNAMIADINGRPFSFSSHVGDIGPGSSSTCTNATVDTETNRFDTLEKPLVYTPGDNEWTDCSDQLLRLTYIRQKVFRTTGTSSRGKAPMTLESQVSSGYPENARWRRGPVTFATLHIVGSNDNYSQQAEFAPRRQATINWLRATFDAAEARNDEGVVLIAQADANLDQTDTGTKRTAYQSMYDAIRDEVASFDGEVLYVNGDGHSYRNLQPIDGVDNLRQVQVEGSSTVSYVRVHIDPGGDSLFSITSPRRF